MLDTSNNRKNINSTGENSEETESRKKINLLVKQLENLFVEVLVIYLSISGCNKKGSIKKLIKIFQLLTCDRPF